MFSLRLGDELPAEPEREEADRFDQQKEGEGDDEIEGPVRLRPLPAALLRTASG
jgi:hypothetical protein